MCVLVFFFLFSRPLMGSVNALKKKINNNSRFEPKLKSNSPAKEMGVRASERQKNYALSLKTEKCAMSDGNNGSNSHSSSRRRRSENNVKKNAKELYESSIKQNVEKPIDTHWLQM